MESQEYCFTCHKDVNYVITEEETVVEYRGEVVKYKELEARCACCHSPLEVDKIWDENLARLKKAFCLQKHRACAEDINQIRREYSISEATLALMIGCGIATIKRYVAGELPSKVYSDKILQIKNNPAFFLTTLMGIKDKLSKVQYNKAEKIAHDRMRTLFSCITECTVLEIPKKKALDVCFA